MAKPEPGNLRPGCQLLLSANSSVFNRSLLRSRKRSKLNGTSVAKNEGDRRKGLVREKLEFSDVGIDAALVLYDRLIHCTPINIWCLIRIKVKVSWV